MEGRSISNLSCCSKISAVDGSADTSLYETGEDFVKKGENWQNNAHKTTGSENTIFCGLLQYIFMLGWTQIATALLQLNSFSRNWHFPAVMVRSY